MAPKREQSKPKVVAKDSKPKETMATTIYLDNSIYTSFNIRVGMGNYS
jgi:hypothetical protein